jgi:hypothetical protein
VIVIVIVIVCVCVCVRARGEQAEVSLFRSMRYTEKPFAAGS